MDQGNNGKNRMHSEQVVDAVNMATQTDRVSGKTNVYIKFIVTIFIIICISVGATNFNEF